MSTLTKIDPLQIILSCTKAQEQYHIEQFKLIIQKLYQYKIFKPMLDLVVSIAMDGHLSFVIYDQKLFDLDEGNCKTIEGGAMNKLLNRVKSQNEYLITIKKIRNDVIVHEIAHMLEKELNKSDALHFIGQIKQDMMFFKKSNPSLSSAVESIMIKEVALYPEPQRNSELFARYFQLLAMSKEVSGFGASYGYSILDVIKLFKASGQVNLYNSIDRKINKTIAKESSLYIKDLNEIEHKWSDEKVQSLHYKTGGVTKWSSGVKSIKEDPFK